MRRVLLVMVVVTAGCAQSTSSSSPAPTTATTAHVDSRACRYPGQKPSDVCGALGTPATTNGLLLTVTPPKQSASKDESGGWDINSCVNVTYRNTTSSPVSFGTIDWSMKIVQPGGVVGPAAPGQPPGHSRGGLPGGQLASGGHATGEVCFTPQIAGQTRTLAGDELVIVYAKILGTGPHVAWVAHG